MNLEIDEKFELYISYLNNDLRHLCYRFSYNPRIHSYKIKTKFKPNMGRTQKELDDICTFFKKEKIIWRYWINPANGHHIDADWSLR